MKVETINSKNTVMGINDVEVHTYVERNFSDLGLEKIPNYYLNLLFQPRTDTAMVSKITINCVEPEQLRKLAANILALANTVDDEMDKIKEINERVRELDSQEV